MEAAATYLLIFFGHVTYCVFFEAYALLRKHQRSVLLGNADSRH